MTRLYLLEPESPGAAWVPFTGVRPIAELRAGAWLIRERWEATLGAAAAGIIGAHVNGFADTDSPPVVSADRVAGPALVARSDFVPPREAIQLGPDCRRLIHEGATVAWWVPPQAEWNGAGHEGQERAVDGLPLRGAFDLVTALERLLASDCLEFTAAAADPVPDGCVVIGDPTRVVCLGASVEPGTVFDVREGAVVLAEGASARSGTRLEGPLYAGPGTRLLGGQLRHCAFGRECRVHGEVAGSVFVGYANKSHDGFVGHTVVGQWVNLGAGTITSNLKNTYGPVRLEVAGERIETARTFLGSLLGDHAKTAIGTLLGTGTVIGAGANVFGPGPVPKFVPPFAWGLQGNERLDVEGFLRVSRRVLPRRGVLVTVEREAALRQLYNRQVS